MKSVYIDSVFFINLLTDYLLCLLSARICGLRLKRLRYLFSAFLGALYSVFVFIPGFEFLGSAPIKLLSGISMALIAYAGETQPFICTGVFLGVSAAFGGALWAIRLSGGLEGPAVRISFKLLLSAFSLCYALGCIIFRCRLKSTEKKKVETRLCFLNKSCSFMALLDTGNSLSDPISGAQVMVVSPHALKPVFRENTAIFQQLSPVELMEFTQLIPELRGKFRLISYRALGVSGLLPVFRPESLRINGKDEKDILVAVSESACGDGFEALL